MISNSKRFIDKNSVVTPENHPLDINIPEVHKIILEYAFDHQTHVSWLQKPFTFFSVSSVSDYVATLVYQASSFKRIEAYIRINPSILLKKFNRNGMEGTLLQMAIMCLNIKMADMLLKLHQELLPDSYGNALKQAVLAAPILDEKVQKNLEQNNMTIIHQTFNVFITGSKNHIDKAIENFNQFLKQKKPETIRNYLYTLDLIHLISCAFDRLAKKGDELPQIEGEEKVHWHGKLADRYCFKIIGAIQRQIDSRYLQQMFKRGLYYALNNKKQIDYSLDIDASDYIYLGDPSLSHELGINFYYDDISVGESPTNIGGRVREAEECGDSFKNLSAVMTKTSENYLAMLKLNDEVMDVEPINIQNPVSLSTK